MEFEQPTTSHHLHQQHQQQPAFLQKQQNGGGVEEEREDGPVNISSWRFYSPPKRVPYYSPQQNKSPRHSAQPNKCK